MIDHPTSRLSPEFVLLGFLYKNPGHGYDLHKRMQAEFQNIWHASQSQTYTILKRLASQGYITSVQIEQVKLPPRQFLFITSAGEKRFENWLITPTKASVHAIRVEFISRLYFMRLYYPDKVPEMIRTQVEVVADGLKHQEDYLKALPGDLVFDKLALELRIELLHSVISWLKESVKVFEPEQPKGADHV